MNPIQSTSKNRDPELLSSLRAQGAIIPPSAVELERAVLGALLIEVGQLSAVASIVQPGDFYEPRNAIVYSVMLEMSSNYQKIDLLTVSQSPRIAGQEGFLFYLTELCTSITSSAHTVYHSQIIKQKSIARKLLSAGLEIASQANDETLDVADVLTNASNLIGQVAETAVSGKGARHISQLACSALKECENRCSAYTNDKPTGISTGLHDLDRLTGGWKPSQLIILAARPAMGKTALMLHLAKSAAMQGIPVCVYSLEMSDVSLANRLLLSECTIDVDNFRSGRLTSTDWQELQQATARLEKLPIYVDDKASVSMQYIKSHSAIMAKKGKCGLIMCDYLQLADMSSSERGRSREQEVTATSAKAKNIAKELNVPFVMLSQLNRGVEGRVDKKPLLSDLRESGSIEQDADIVAFIYRPAYYGVLAIPTRTKGDISSEGVGAILISKQRDGATGDVHFRHNPSMTKIYDFDTVNPSTSKEPF